MYSLKANIETLKNERENIIITEIPYQVNKATLIEKLPDLFAGKVEVFQTYAMNQTVTVCVL